MPSPSASTEPEARSRSTEGRPVTATRLERAGDLAARVSSLRPSDPNMRRGLHAGIVIVVVLSVGLAAFAGAGDLPEIDWRLRPWALVLATIGMATFLLANAAIWRRLLRALGPELGPRQARAIWFTSALGRYVPGNLLLPMLRVAIADRVGVPKRICAASVLYEIALVLTATLAVSAYFVIDLPDLRATPARFLVLAVPGLAALALHPRFFHSVADRVLDRLGRARLPLSLSGVRIAEFAGLYALTFVVAGLSLYALAQSVYPVPGSDLITVAAAFAVGTTLSILSFVLPGGLGAREAGIAVALSPVMPAAPAVAIAVLARILQMALELVFAVVTPLLARSTASPGLRLG